jgi:hypothetical protein
LSGVASLDEVWRDPLHWKLVVTTAGGTLAEIDDGVRAYTTGTIVPGAVADIVLETEAALFNPFRLSLSSLKHLTLERQESCRDRSARSSTGLPHSIHCVAMGAEPALAGVPDEDAVAVTHIVLSWDDASLLRIRYPTGAQRGFSDYAADFLDAAPFGSKQIPRTIELLRRGEVAARMHITRLEQASDFSALAGPIAAGASVASAHSQGTLLADELMLGDVLSGSDLRPLLGPLIPRKISVVGLKVHIDVRGRVTGSEVTSDRDHLMTQAISDAIKTWRFRISYRGDRAVPVDQIVTIWSGTP